jgi:hypothetical protein
MFNSANLFRMMSEMILVLLGGLLVWGGLNFDHRYFDARWPSWVFIGAVIVFSGVRALMKTRQAARNAQRTTARVGGVSMVIVGLTMLGLVFVQFRWVGMALAVAGGIVVIRGLVSAALSLRTD